MPESYSESSFQALKGCMVPYNVLLQPLCTCMIARLDRTGYRAMICKVCMAMASSDPRVAFAMLCGVVQAMLLPGRIHWWSCPGLLRQLMAEVCDVTPSTKHAWV